MNYPHICDVYHVQHTKDQYLSTDETTVISISNLDCWLQPYDSEEEFVQGREDEDITHVMYCPVREIEYTDQINVTKGPYQGKVYEIVGIENEAGINHHLKLTLKKANS